jgi:sortase (surface protein transpeptidase)
MNILKQRFWRASLSALLVFMLAMLVLNGQLLDAQWRYRTHSLGNSLRTQTASAAVQPSDQISTSPQILIPKLNVAAPIILNSKADNASMSLALRRGTVHYPGTALPGQDGKVVIFGHSSGALANYLVIKPTGRP